MNKDFYVQEEKLVKYIGNDKKVTIPSCIKSIEKEAFSNNESLESIVIPREVISMDEGVFEGCKNLKKVELYGEIKTLPKKAFKDCINLNSITLPYSLETIDEYSFYGCESLEDIFLPENLININKYAFTDNKIKKLHIPSSIKSIKDTAFYNCQMLKDIYITASIFHNFGGAFDKCNNIKNIHLTNNSIYFVEDGLVYSEDYSKVITVIPMSNNDTVYVHNNVNTVRDGAFENCYYLKCILFRNTNIKIKKEWFGKGLENVGKIAYTFLPHSFPNDIVYYAFYDVININKRFKDKYRKTYNYYLSWSRRWNACINWYKRNCMKNIGSKDFLLDFFISQKYFSLDDVDALLEKTAEHEQVVDSAKILQYKNDNFSQREILEHSMKKNNFENFF